MLGSSIINKFKPLGLAGLAAVSVTACGGDNLDKQKLLDDIRLHRRLNPAENKAWVQCLHEGEKIGSSYHIAKNDVGCVNWSDDINMVRNISINGKTLKTLENSQGQKTNLIVFPEPIFNHQIEGKDEQAELKKLKDQGVQVLDLKPIDDPETKELVDKAISAGHGADKKDIIPDKHVVAKFSLNLREARNIVIFSPGNPGDGQKRQLEVITQETGDPNTVDVTIAINKGAIPMLKTYGGADYEDKIYIQKLEPQATNGD